MSKRTDNVAEKAVNGYETSYNGYNITNTLITTSILVTKVWVDESDHDGFRPSSITVRLLANGTEVASKVLTSSYATDFNTWEYEFTNLNKFDKSGASITYTVTEDTVTNTNGVNYESIPSCDATTNGYTFQNKLLPDTTASVSGTKTWNDTGNTSIRPESITVTVTGTVGSGSSASTVYGPNDVTVSAASDGTWSYSLTGLYKYYNGEAITYSASEKTVNGYETTYSGYNITNTLITTSVSVTKNWVDESNHDGFRPDSITIRLLANGTEIASKTLTSSNATDTNTWVTEFTNLNKYDKRLLKMG